MTTEQSLTSEIGASVFLFDRIRPIPGTIVGVHYADEKVNYDVELSFKNKAWDFEVKTRIRDVNSAFVCKDWSELPINQNWHAEEVQ